MHRSGRTGRAGRKGICVTLFAPKQRATLQTIERSTKNKFEWIGAPQPRAIMLTAAQTAVDDAAAVTPDLRACFAESADELLKRFHGDAAAAVAAALAVAKGYTKPPPARSLLSSAEGFVTVKFEADPGQTVQSLGLVWAALRRAFPAGFTDFRTDGMDNVRGMT